MRLESPYLAKPASSFSPRRLEAWRHESDISRIRRCAVSTASPSKHWISECVEYAGQGYSLRSRVDRSSSVRVDPEASRGPRPRIGASDAAQPIRRFHLMIAQKG